MGVTITPAQISRGIISNESGGRNVVSPQGARGPGQIMPATFRQYARPGEDINNPADNMAVHNRIIADYASRWPNDPARVAVAYFSGPGNVAPPGSPTPWKRNVSDVNESVAKYVANAGAKMGGPPGAPAVATTPGTTLNTPPPPPPPATTIANALTGGTGANGQGLSPIQQAQQASSGEGGQALPPAAAPQLGPGDMHNAQVAAQAPALMAAWRQAAAQPLTWSSRPFGSNAGLQAPVLPGTTLNSTGGAYA